MIEISIVIPVYNAEKYIDECLHSIFCQTYKDYELIIVDDSSTDSTAHIVNIWMEQDKRIKMISNPYRMGAAVSRNKGLFAARGRYICFLDGDDIFDITLLESWHKKIVESSAQICLVNYAHGDSKEIYRIRNKNRGEKFYQSYSRGCFNFFDCFVEKDLFGLNLATCSGLYEMKFIIDNEIVFQDLPRQNDFYFCAMALLCAEKIIFSDNDRILVHARDHDSSTRITNNRNPYCTYYAVMHVLENLKKKDLLRKSLPIFGEIAVSAILFQLNRCNSNKQQVEYYCFLRNTGALHILEKCGSYLSLLGYKSINKLESLELDMELSWWNLNEDEWLNLFLNANSRRIIERFVIIASKGYRIVIWGAGKNGACLLRFCKKYNINIYSLMDSDEEKTGRYLEGTLIERPIDESEYIICVATNDSIFDYAVNRFGITHVIDIHEIIGKKFTNHRICI